MKRAARLTAISFGTLLSACQMVGPDYQVPQDGAINRPDLQGELAGRSVNAVSAPVPAHWWRLYQDPRLDQLVRQAMASNTDLRVAAANLQRSRYQNAEAEAAGGFTSGAKIGAQRVQESGEAYLLTDKVPVSNVGDVGLTTAYQFDLFGTLQRGIEAAQANVDANQAAVDTARITVVADVVRAYTQICAANEELDIARESLDLQQQSLTLNRRLRDAGRGDETQVTRSQTQFKSLRAEMPRYEARRQAAMFRLSMLLAKPVDQLPTGVSTCNALPHIAQVMPVGDGAALLKRRPDVRQAERHLALSTAEIGVATGELYPDISIGASIGTTGLIENLGKPAANRWGFGPLLNWTVPSNGSRARIHQAEASAQAALARFDGVVLNAIRETQTGLAQYTALLDRRDALKEAEQSAKEAADQTHRFYQAGRASFLADLQATRTYTDVRAQMAEANTEVAMGQINLFLALGGGWEKDDVAEK
ncbi:efflux transporter outer membrane subunit [Pseudomonas coronafaciens]|uniref:efflux transporter outer membrane subunit n=1 Tax=Pseudomonas coronafaciens TaxID=53409 RepID=UPI0006B575AD|nr:efflux transporter outer membrane subunit [Pseudomonas coronafaciens]KPB50405.1 NodT family outer membrane efflux lipoprotein [Pseudomonas coronafaciens pv. oryzae]RMT03096.1 NodT family outer membrane efflux lipoprotein [Pseudomonas coronafaciens pv. oryzae]